MSEPKRRFFSGDSLQQALVQAANYYNLDPEEIAYRSIEKKHGFIKVRRKVVIEVDPEAPRRDKAAPAPAAPAAPRPAVPLPVPPPLPPAAERAPRAPQEHRERGDDRRGARDDRPRRDDRRERRDDRRGPGGAQRPRREDRLERGRREREEWRGRREAKEPRAEQAPPREPRFSPPSFTDELDSRLPPLPAFGSLVALPDTPRRTAERFPPAEGPQAEAAARGAELLLRVAGLDLAPRVLQGDGRLEVDLAGPDADWCFADDGELVLAVEHLLPRLIRSLSGEAVLVRVDCDNFQEIREERLRSLAQRVAEEVRRLRKPRTLEPMNPGDRRIVHVTLADDPGVETESEGDGYFKRITVRPA